MAEPPDERTKTDVFVEKVDRDVAGGYIAAMGSIGVSLGLFQALADVGPATSPELATRAEIGERYAREWLAAMASAEYVTYDPVQQRFALPPEHVPVLVHESGPFSRGGDFLLFASLLTMVETVSGAFRIGGGVPSSAYPSQFWSALEQCSAIAFENSLLPKWIPAMPEIEAKLKRGANVADVGCGHGRAILKLAQAFPTSRFVGYDAYGPAVARAAELAAAANLHDRVRFEERDAAGGIPEKYDIIMTFDVVHDAVDPLGLLREIRQALKTDGTFLLMDFPTSSRLEENVGTAGAMIYSISVLYCMTSSLAHGGAGLGTAGFHEPKVREMCVEAGFTSVRRLPFGDTALYEVKP